jgi:hypothetical protein
MFLESYSQQWTQGSQHVTYAMFLEQLIVTHLASGTTATDVRAGSYMVIIRITNTAIRRTSQHQHIQFDFFYMAVSTKCAVELIVLAIV